MDNRILWDIIDGLRDELNVAQDGITELNDVIKDLQAEAIEQIRDNKRLNDKDGLYDEVRELQAEIELDEGVILARNKEVDDLKAENKRLQVIIDKGIAELDKVKKGNIDTIMDVGLDNETLQHEIFKLEADIKELKAELENKKCGCVVPKEYKQEARDYMNHNPKVNKVYFFMVADDCIGDDGFAQDWACSVDDAIAIIDNDNI